MKAIKRNYRSGGGANMSDMQDLFYGSLAEREVLATAITNKGVKTNSSDTLTVMAQNISQLNTGLSLGNLTYTSYNQTKTIDVSQILTNYESLTVLDFKAFPATADYTYNLGSAGSVILNYYQPVLSYEPSTGILSVKGPYYYWTAANWGSGYHYFTTVEVIYLPKS